MNYIDFEHGADWGPEDVGQPILDELIEAASAKARTDWEKEFCRSVAEQYANRGSLSAKQVAILERITNPPERVRQAARVSPLDLRNVPSGRYAVPGGDTRLKVQIDNVDDGKWIDWIFVKDAAEYGQGKRYGAQRPGQLYSGDIQDALRAIAADPLAASKAYGRLVGRCGVCGRHLENEESVEAGIGPYCREKFGVSL